MLKNATLALVFLMLAIVVGAAQSTDKPPSNPSTEETILELEKEYGKALIDGGFKTLDKLLSDSYTVWDSKGELQPTTKKDILEDTDTKVLTYETSGLDVVIKDGVATVTGNLKSERKNSASGRFLIEGKFERTWKLKNGIWSITGYKASVKTTPLDGGVLASQVRVTEVDGSEVPTTWSTKIVIRIYGHNLDADGVSFGINGKDVTTYITERKSTHVVLEAKDEKKLNIKGKKQDNELTVTINGVTKVVWSFTWR